LLYTEGVARLER